MHQEIQDQILEDSHNYFITLSNRAEFAPMAKRLDSILKAFEDMRVFSRLPLQRRIAMDTRLMPNAREIVGISEAHHLLPLRHAVTLRRQLWQLERLSDAFYRASTVENELGPERRKHVLHLAADNTQPVPT